MKEERGEGSDTILPILCHGDRSAAELKGIKPLTLMTTNWPVNLSLIISWGHVNPWYLFQQQTNSFAFFSSFCHKYNIYFYFICLITDLDFESIKSL